MHARHTSLLHSIIYLYPAPVACNTLLGYVLRRFDRIICGCVSVPMDDISNFPAFSNKAHDAIDSILSQRICMLFCSRLSVLCVNVVVLFVDGFAWSVVFLALYAFSNGTSVAQLIETVFPIPSFWIDNMLGDN